MSFKDIFKKSFLEGFSSAEITTPTIVVALGIACVLALYIFFVYRIVTRKTFYSKSFNITLAVITVITAALILTMQSSVVLSLGMVGALSIVRFRTAVKEPTDTAFLFWAIATGIICGAGYITISILMTLLLGLLFVAVHACAGKQKHSTYMIVIRYDSDSDVENKLAGISGYKMKNKTMTGNYTELVAELKLTDAALKKIDFLRNIPGVREVTVMSSVSGSVL